MMQSRFLEMESTCIAQDRKGSGDCHPSARIRENESRASGEYLRRLREVVGPDFSIVGASMRDQDGRRIPAPSPRNG